MKTVISFVTKKGHVMIGMIIMMLLTVLDSTTVFASISEECLNGLLSGNIMGRAWDSSTPDTPATVKAVIKKYSTFEIVRDITLSAEEYRDNLKTSGKGTGKYGFTVPITWNITDTNLYPVEYAVNDKVVTNFLYCQSGEIASAANGGLTPLGTFKITAYCPYRSCSSSWGGRTNTGTVVTADHIIPVDPSVTPYGSHVMTSGVICTAGDIGNGVNREHTNIFFNTHTECRSYGVRDMKAFPAV